MENSVALFGFVRVEDPLRTEGDAEPGPRPTVEASRLAATTTTGSSPGFSRKDSSASTPTGLLTSSSDGALSGPLG